MLKRKGNPMGDETIRKCSSCGRVLDSGEDICTKCGAIFEEDGESSEGEGSIREELLSLANDFLCVSKITPQWFELTSRPGAQVPDQKVTIKYQAVAQLVPEKYQVIFWEKMMETLVGMVADSSQASSIQTSIYVNQEIHGHLMFGGPYGFHYDRLHRVVKAIANEQGWQFILSTSKPAMDITPSRETALPSREDDEKAQMDTGPAGGASVRAQGEAAYPDTPRKSRRIPAILAGAVMLVVVAGLVGILSKGMMKETPVAEKPKTAAAAHAALEAQKAGGAAQKPPVPAISAAVDYNAQGMKKAKAGNMEEAAGLFEKAVQASPDNFNAWNNLGLALRKIGRNEEAVKAYRRAISIKPDFALVYKNLGIVFEQMGRKKEAAEAYLKYAELNQSAADARTARKKAATLKSAAQGKETRP
jgi:tetratricopeptide (TPR) repeat protein